MSVCDTIASKFFVWTLQGLTDATFGFGNASFCPVFEKEAPVGFKNGKIEEVFVGTDPIFLFEVTDSDLDLWGDCKKGVLVDTLETVFVSST